MTLHWFIVCFEADGRLGYGKGSPISGPYPTKETADAMVETARRYAEEIDHWAVFYTWGVGLIDRDEPCVLENLGYLPESQPVTNQPPLFPLPPEAPKPDVQDRLQALYDGLYDNRYKDVKVVRRRDGWYLSYTPRWIGDDGLEWIGQTEAEAAANLRREAR